MQSSPHFFQKEPKTIAIKFARLVSDFISPPVVYAVMGFLLAWYALPTLEGVVWGAFYGFFISLVPVLYVLYLYRVGRVRDMHMSDIRQRRIPYLISIVGAVIVFGSILTFDGPELLGSLAVSNFIGLTILWIINFYWLISSHMASISLAGLFIMFVFGIQTVVLVLPLVMLVFWARLVLRRHTPLQLTAGMVVGIFTILFIILIGLL